MDPTVYTDLAQIVLSIALTIWIARTLFKGGRIFLVDVFHRNHALANSVNHLLVVGFYLPNLRFVSLFLRLESDVPNARASIEA